MYIIFGFIWCRLVICTMSSFITIRKSVQKIKGEYLISLIFIFPKNLSQIHISFSFVLIKMTESSQKAFSKRDSSNTNVTTLFARNYTHFTNDISCFHITTTGYHTVTFEWNFFEKCNYRVRKLPTFLHKMSRCLKHQGKSTESFSISTDLVLRN